MFWLAPAVCVAEPVTVNLAETSALTATVRRSVPVVVIAVAPEPPSAAEATTFAVSALYSFIAFDAEAAVETPLANVSVSPVPKLTVEAPFLLVTVGLLAPIVVAPGEGIVWAPV